MLGKMIPAAVTLAVGAAAAGAAVIKKKNICPVCEVKKAMKRADVHIKASTPYNNGVAKTPPMGWSSWNTFRNKIDENLILETQIWMAQKTAKLHCDLCAAAGVEDFKPELWLVGYSELKGKGFFIPYRDELKKIYETDGNLWWNNVYVFQHFSMNRFTIDLSEYCKSEHYENRALMENIHDLGQLHKQEIFYEI